ncbi:MAG: hypothetical protein ACOC1X_03005 [Promethearchaeota archaeon]
MTEEIVTHTDEVEVGDKIRKYSVMYEDTCPEKVFNCEGIVDEILNNREVILKMDGGDTKELHLQYDTVVKVVK